MGMLTEFLMNRTLPSHMPVVDTARVPAAGDVDHSQAGIEPAGALATVVASNAGHALGIGIRRVAVAGGLHDVGLWQVGGIESRELWGHSPIPLK